MRMKAVFAVMLGLFLGGIRSGRGAEPPKPAQAQPAVASSAVLFLRDVMPLVTRLGCNSVQCHGATQGKGGLALSLFGAEPDWDYQTVVYGDAARRVNRWEPAKSLFLLKSTAAVAHGGGPKIQPGSAEASLLLAWLAQGAPYDDPKLPKLVAVKAAPQEQVLQKGPSAAGVGSGRFLRRHAEGRHADGRFSSPWTPKWPP